MLRCIRTTLTIEDGLLEEARRRARKQKTTLGAVVNEALRFGLLRSGQPPAAGSIPPLQTFRGDGLQPGVDLRNSAELHEIMEPS